MSPGIVRYTFNRTFLSNREREDSAFLRERSIDNACLVSITPLDSRLGSIRTRFVSAPYQFQACETRSFSVPHSNNRVFFLRERSKDSREHGYPIERERESTLPLCCQGEISVEIWDSTFASIHVKFSWERKFTSRRFQIRLEGFVSRGFVRRFSPGRWINCSTDVRSRKRFLARIGIKKLLNNLFERVDNGDRICRVVFTRGDN